MVKMNVRSVLWMGVVLSLTACAATPLPMTERKHQLAPVHSSVTTMKNTLACMDQLLGSHKKESPVVLVHHIEVEALKGVGLRELVKSAVVDSTTRSRALELYERDYVEIGTQGKVSFLDGLYRQGKLGGVLENKLNTGMLYYISGGVSFLDNNTFSDKKSVGGSTPWFDFGASKNKSASTVSINLRVHSADGQIRTQVSNEISFVTQGKGIDATLNSRFRGNGISLSFTDTIEENQGVGIATKTLVEASVAELLGKFSGVPYWVCFNQSDNAPQFTQKTQQVWRDMQTPAREQFFRSALIRNAYLREEDKSAPYGAFTGALKSYQSDRNLHPSGQLDYDTYVAMLTDVPHTEDGLLKLWLPSEFDSLTEGDPIGFYIRPSRQAFVTCFYQSEGVLMKVFPNPWQRTPFVKAGQAVDVPSRKGLLLASKPGPEGVDTILCASKPTVYNKEGGMVDLLPAPLKNAPTLTSLNHIVQHSADLKKVLEASGFEVDVMRLTVSAK